MAFLPQPTLPSTRKSSSRVRVSTRAVADGVISVSRRRRVYEFLSATSKPAASTVSDNATTHASVQESTKVVSKDSTPDPIQVRDQLIARMKQREQAIKDDAAKKQALWKAELDALRSINLKPTPTDSSAAPPKDTTVSERTKPSATPVAAAPASTTSSSVKPAASTVAAPAAPATPAAPAAPATAAAVSTPQPAAPAASVSELYSPPSTTEEKGDSRPWGFQDLVEDFQEAVEDVREKVEDVVEDMRDAVEDVVEDVIEVFQHDEEEDAKEKKATESAAESESETSQVAVEDKQDRSIGEVIIDAIVEGVDTPEPETAKPAVDKTDLIELVDSGKIKNLTVTKLRRLLTQNGLKTSGRKAELIARLTSFAKAK